MHDKHSNKAAPTVRQLFYQKTKRVARASIFVLSLTCWLHEQRLSKTNSEEFTSDERKEENEINIFSDYKAEQNAINQIEVQLNVYG